MRIRYPLKQGTEKHSKDKVINTNKEIFETRASSSRHVMLLDILES